MFSSPVSRVLAFRSSWPLPRLLLAQEFWVTRWEQGRIASISNGRSDGHRLRQALRRSTSSQFVRLNVVWIFYHLDSRNLARSPEKRWKAKWPIKICNSKTSLFEKLNGANNGTVQLKGPIRIAKKDFKLWNLLCSTGPTGKSPTSAASLAWAIPEYFCLVEDQVLRGGVCKLENYPSVRGVFGRALRFKTLEVFQ